jgi:phytoene synthase
VISRLLTFPPTEAEPINRAAFIAARQICRRHARSFYFASHFLPVPKRYAAYAVYAFCRLLDDAVDQAEESGFADSAARLTAINASIARFEAVLHRAYDGTALPDGDDESALALRAFAITVRRYGIAKQHFIDLAAGCRMDLTISRYQTWPDLQRYCYLVAGVVGLIMCPIFGLSNPAAQKQAIQMGEAMQLTNILRDVAEDFDRGRVYLPQEDLARFGYTDEMIATRVVDDRYRALMRFEINRARSLYYSAAEGLCDLADDGSRLTACAMGVIYAGILGAIEAQSLNVYASRAHLTTIQKLAKLPDARRLAQKQRGEAMPRVFG